MRETFQGKKGWLLVGNRGGLYSQDLAASEFCSVPPGGDGWSSRVDDAVRHGCIPVIIMDDVLMPFEGLLDYDAFALRIPEADIEKLDATLRAEGPHAAREGGMAQFAHNPTAARAPDGRRRHEEAGDGRVLLAERATDAGLHRHLSLIHI